METRSIRRIDLKRNGLLLFRHEMRSKSWDICDKGKFHARLLVGSNSGRILNRSRLHVEVFRRIKHRLGSNENRAIVDINLVALTFALGEDDLVFQRLRDAFDTGLIDGTSEGTNQLKELGLSVSGLDFDKSLRWKNVPKGGLNRDRRASLHLDVAWLDLHIEWNRFSFWSNSGNALALKFTPVRRNKRTRKKNQQKGPKHIQPREKRETLLRNLVDPLFAL